MPVSSSEANSFPERQANVDHIPVMAEEIAQFVGEAGAEVVFDGTLGLGGHCRILLERFSHIKHYIGVDVDEKALSIARERLSEVSDRVSLFHGSYENIDVFVEEANHGQPQVVFVDLGASTMQLKDGERGFSFSEDGPLDMRMNQSTSYTAYDLIKNSSAENLQEIFSKYGEFRFSGRVARALAQASIIPRTTKELAAFVCRCIPSAYVKKSKKHPATQIFQALRIAVNDELAVIERALPKLFSALAPGGLFIALSFHSLEDRLVKTFLKDGLGTCVCDKRLPRCVCNAVPLLKIITRKPVVASARELEGNRPSRSAKLRVARKL